MSDIFFTEKNGIYTIPIIRDGFTINDENPEFSDDFLVNWSYPYNVYQTNIIRRLFPDFTNPNIIKRKKDSGFLNIMGDVYPADIKFLGAQLNQLKVQFEFGVGVLPIMDKQLNEIDFGEFDTPNIYDYVDDNIGKKYPEVNFCFPQIYNNYFFKENYGTNWIDGNWPIFNLAMKNDENKLKIYRNIIGPEKQLIVSAIKPIPYLIFVLKKAFENEGYILKGDILEDEMIKDMCLDHNNTTDDVFLYDIKTLEAINNSNESTAYQKRVVFEIVGDYTVSFFCPKPKADASVSLELLNKSTNEVMYSFGYSWSRVEEENSEGDFHFLFDLPTIFEPTEVEYIIRFSNINNFTPFNSSLKAFLNPRLNKSNNNKFILQKKKFKGNEYMPEGNFKDLVLMVKRLRNFHVYTSLKNEIFFDYIDNKPPNDYLNLEFSEQQDVEINSNSKLNYIITCNSPEVMNLPSYLVSDNRLVEINKEDYKISELLEINGYPLLTTVNDSAIVPSVEERERNVQGFALFKYKGLSENGYNYSQEIESFILKIYQERYINYINNRLSADLMKWSFLTKKNMNELKSIKAIYVYGAFHKIKSLTKTFFEDNVTKFDIETENRY